MWQQPKTDWKSGDTFNIEDYNRIKGNLNEIRSLALILWPDFTFEDMGADKTYEDYAVYADEFNLFETNIRHICEGTFPFEVGSSRVFYENTPFASSEELNRLEAVCLKLYRNIKSGVDGRQQLEFVLNGGDF